MYAVIKTGGKQYKVSKDDVISVEKLSDDAGKKIKLNEVLIISDKGKPKTGEADSAKADNGPTTVKQLINKRFITTLPGVKGSICFKNFCVRADMRKSA